MPLRSNAIISDNFFPSVFLVRGGGGGGVGGRAAWFSETDREAQLSCSC